MQRLLSRRCNILRESGRDDGRRGRIDLNGNVAMVLWCCMVVASMLKLSRLENEKSSERQENLLLSPQRLPSANRLGICPVIYPNLLSYISTDPIAWEPL